MSEESFSEYILEQLSGLEHLRLSRMFGGHGLYQNDVFFAILYQGALYFKTDAQTSRQYKKHGMKPFSPNARQTLKNYYEVPAEIFEDADTLTEWARQAVQAGDG